MVAMERVPFSDSLNFQTCLFLISVTEISLAPQPRGIPEHCSIDNQTCLNIEQVVYAHLCEVDWMNSSQDIEGTYRQNE